MTTTTRTQGWDDAEMRARGFVLLTDRKGRAYWVKAARA